MRAAEIKELAAMDAMARLRWRVLSYFGVLPSSAQARGMSDADCVLFAANMLLDYDAREAKNPEFDASRFHCMREAQNG